MDLKRITGDKRLAISTDKTSNKYFISKEKYSKLLVDSITSEYRTAENDTIKDVITSEKEVAAKVDLSDRMEVPAKVEARITIKDTKPNFKTDTKC